MTGCSLSVRTFARQIDVMRCVAVVL